MAIHRAPRPDEHFTQIRNGTLRDDRLSYRARGLLASILSRPDDWSTSAEALARSGSEGRDAIRTALAELETAGYLRREKRQDGRGRWSTQSVMYDTPQDVPQEEAALFALPPTTDSQASVSQPSVLQPSVSQASLEQRHEQPPTGGADKRTPPQLIAARIYDHAQGMVAFMAMHQVAVRALRVKGATVESVGDAMVKLYDAGKPITLQTVGQELGRRSGSFKETNGDHWAKGGGF